MAIYSLRHPEGLSLRVSTLGATWLSCEVPLADGSRRPVVLARDEEGSAGTRAAFLGNVVGRYANRIAGARISMGERQWRLATGVGQRHQLHGGPGGFHARQWQVRAHDEMSLRLALVSQDGDQGYPGQLTVKLDYRLLDAMTLEMEVRAATSQACPVCITHHAYFNLDGHVGDARGHGLQLNARRWLPVDADLIPAGPLCDVQGTGFDFREPKPIGRDWLCDDQQRHASGYDHAFLLDEACRGMQGPALELSSRDGLLAMQMYTTLPALQLYAGQHLRDVATPDGSAVPACGGVALEPQFLPDSPHHPEWPQPSCWLLPGQTYCHSIRWRFASP